MLQFMIVLHQLVLQLHLLLFVCASYLSSQLDVSISDFIQGFQFIVVNRFVQMIQVKHWIRSRLWLLHHLMLGWVKEFLLVHVHGHSTVVLGLLLLGAVALVRSIHLTRLRYGWLWSIWLLALMVELILLSKLLVDLLTVNVCLMLVLVLESHILVLLLLCHKIWTILEVINLWIILFGSHQILVNLILNLLLCVELKTFGLFTFLNKHVWILINHLVHVLDGLFLIILKHVILIWEIDVLMAKLVDVNLIRHLDLTSFITKELTVFAMFTDKIIWVCIFFDQNRVHHGNTYLAAALSKALLNILFVKLWHNIICLINIAILASKIVEIWFIYLLIWLILVFDVLLLVLSHLLNIVLVILWLCLSR